MPIVEPRADATQLLDGIGELHCRSVDSVQNERFVCEEAIPVITNDAERFMDNGFFDDAAHQGAPGPVTGDWEMEVCDPQAPWP